MITRKIVVKGIIGAVMMGVVSCLAGCPMQCGSKPVPPPPAHPMNMKESGSPCSPMQKNCGYYKGSSSVHM